MPPDPVVTVTSEKALAFLEAGELDKALQTLQPAIAAAPDDVDVGNLHALLLSRLTRFNEALSVLEAFPQPEDANWLRLRGHVLNALGNHKVAKESLEASLKLAPDSSATYYVLGQTLIGMAHVSASKDKLKKAGLDHLRTSISLAPNSIHARAMLARELLGVRNGQAEQLSRECLELDFENPSSRLLAAEIALRKGDVEAAQYHAQFLLGFPDMQRQAIGILRQSKAVKLLPLRILNKFIWASGRHPLTSWLPMAPLISFAIFMCQYFNVSGVGIYALGFLIIMPWLLFLMLLDHLWNRNSPPVELNNGY